MATREAMPWETADGERAWEKIAVDGAGRLIVSRDGKAAHKRDAVELVGDVKRNLIRCACLGGAWRGACVTRTRPGGSYVYIVVDMSKACVRKDLVPSRLDIAVEDCADFISRFFDQNPLSSVGLIVRRGVACRAVLCCRVVPCRRRRRRR